MITGEIRNKVDRTWEIFWTGGITNPLSVIEQFTYLLFIKGLDEVQTRKEREANMLGTEIENPVFTKEQDHLRWSKFKNKDAVTMYNIVSNEVFPFIKSLHSDRDTAYSKYMKDAIFMIPTPQMLERIVTSIDGIPMKDRDTKGDLYEYLLSKIATSKHNGQFRTPRHIINMIVELMQPKPTDTIIDPASGSAGFLVSASEYLRKHHSEIFRDPELRRHFNNTMFYGNDMDSTMLRIGAMNMMLHGIENPNIEYRDSLAQTNEDKEKYTLVLANPPFKGSLDYDSVAKDLLAFIGVKTASKTKNTNTNSKTKSKNTKAKTELLFLSLFLRILKPGGRCACIVPDGVLFGSSNAHVKIRKEIIDNHRLEAVISMPSGVFKPYAGVSTAILIFTKTNAGGTDNVWFYDMQADGYSLDDKRTELDLQRHEDNNIPDIIQRFHNLEAEKERVRTEQSFFVSVEEIRENKYDLSINRYKESTYEEVEYESPKEIIRTLQQLETEIQQGLKELEDMIG